MLLALAWPLGLLPLAVIGAPLLLDPAYRTLSVGARIVFSGAAGAVIVSWLMVLSSLTRLAWNLWLLAFLGLLCAALLRFALPRGSAGDRLAPQDGGSLVSRAVAAAAIASAAVCTAAGKAASPDMLYHWGVKGEQFAFAGRIDIDFLKHPLLDYMVPHYPPLLPNLYAWTTMVTGHFLWEGASWFFPVFLALTWIAIRGALVDDVGRQAAEAITALLVSAISVIGVAAIFAGIGEMLLLFFEVTGIVLLAGPRGREPAFQLLAGLCLAAAALTKVEGSAVAIPAIAMFLLLGAPSGSRLGPLLRSALPLGVGMGTWLAFGRVSGLFSEYVGYDSLSRLHASRFVEIVQTICRALGSIDYGLPYLLPVACLIATRGRLRAIAIPVGTAVALSGFLIFAYMHGEVDPHEWIHWTAARALSPIPALLTLALAPRFRVEGEIRK